MPSKPHPLRRISTNSLTSLARSQSHATEPSNPTHLAFLAPALQDLIDESASLAHNTHALSTLHDALGTFNDAFAAYLYALRMGAFCVDWKEGPDAVSWERMRALGDPIPPPAPVMTDTGDPPQQEHELHDTTYCTAPDTTATETTVDPPPAARSRPPPSRKPQTATDRRRREAAINAIVDTLPIEYRGSDPVVRQVMERVIGYLMDNPSGQRMPEITKSLALPQPKINKCLIALVAKKAVTKTAVGGVAIYKLV